MSWDRPRLRRRLRGIKRSGGRGQGTDEALRRVEEDVAASRDRRECRRRFLPSPRFPEDLPICVHREEIGAALDAHQVIVVCGETGSGKSTQLPKICLAAGRGVDGLIGHTQPRRIAARSIAARIARELGTPLGQEVGYKIRFSDRTRRDGYIKVMTDGILLAETQSDRELWQYDTIIIDEAHERGLNVDFLLGYLKRLIARRPELKVIITSATIDPQSFSRHFKDAPVIEVSGRAYPVDILWRPVESEDLNDRDRDMQAALLSAVGEVAGFGPGDVLVFLSGEREIRETAKALRMHHPPQTEILPLYARLSAAEQDRVFQSHGGRRIVLATNVAETSLTVPGIRYVVDPGYARISRYSPRSRVQRLPIEPVSQASARQRAGRCGRTAPGVCIRLYDEEDYLSREEYTRPEILRTNLAAVILQMKALGLGNVKSFPFMDPPRRSMIRDGYETLRELGAIDEHERLTALGRRLARLPIDPRLGRMILAAESEDALSEILTIAAALSIQDPRERPMESHDAADAAHAPFADPHSDFMSYLKMWETYHEQKKHLSWNKLRQWCRAQYLSFLRMREWHDIRQQLQVLVTQTGMRPNEEPADFGRIHRSVLSGLVSSIARRGEKHEYTGPRVGAYFIFPGSGLFSGRAQWIMAAEIVETTKRYARCVARIRPQWIERAAPHLVQRTHHHPRWDRRSARVMAHERVTIWGVEIIAKRRVHYGPINPVEARELFIHHALVEGQYDTDAPFFEHNRGLVAELRDAEARRRKRDVLVDAAARFSFYDRRIPAHIYTGGAFERWRREAEKDDPQVLFMTRRDLMRPGAAMFEAEQFPDTLTVGEIEAPLEYHLEPGDELDGVMVTVPLALLNHVAGARLEWLVPGLVREKVIALIKSLPKDLRRNFVPAPDYADVCVERLDFGKGSLVESLGRLLNQITGIPVPGGAWDHGAIPEHLKMNVRVVDDDGKTVGLGRDVEALRRRFSGSARALFGELADERYHRDGIMSWDFDDLPERIEVNSGGMTLHGYPALVDRGDSVSLRVFDAREAAEAQMRFGVRRLFLLECVEDLAVQIEHLPDVEELRAWYRPLGDGERFEGELAALLCDRFFIGDEAPIRNRKQYQARLESGWLNCWEIGSEVMELLQRILGQYARVGELLGALDAPVWGESVEDVRRHLAALMPADFISRTPHHRLAHYPRYLRGIETRLEKLTNAGRLKDRRHAEEMNVLWGEYAGRRADHEARGIHDAALEEYRWLLEEMRISLFAQELGTAVPVSHKRLARLWERVRT